MNFKTINALLCLLLISAQCSSSLKASPDAQYSSGFKAGPEVISCAGDSPPPELQARQPRRERIFFEVNPSEPGEKVRLQAFDVATGTTEDVMLDLPRGQGPLHVSPSRAYFVYRKKTRSEWTGDNNITVYQQPVIRAIDSQAEITPSLEISSGDVLDWSPDGNCLVIIYHGKLEIGLYHLANGQYESWQLPPGLNIPFYLIPLLSPDGRWLAGQCGRETCIMKANGEIVYRAPTNTRFEPHRWSPGSRYLVIGEKDWNLSYLDASSNWAKRPLIDATNCHQGCENFRHLYISDWSPDGTRLAGGISLPGYNSLVVIEFPSGNYHLLSGSSRYPIWSPDSRQLAFTHISSGLDIMDADGQNLKQIKATGVGIEAYPLFWTRGE